MKWVIKNLWTKNSINLSRNKLTAKSAQNCNKYLHFVPIRIKIFFFKNYKFLKSCQTKLTFYSYRSGFFIFSYLTFNINICSFLLREVIFKSQLSSIISKIRSKNIILYFVILSKSFFQIIFPIFDECSFPVVLMNHNENWRRKSCKKNKCIWSK